MSYFTNFHYVTLRKLYSGLGLRTSRTYSQSYENPQVTHVPRHFVNNELQLVMWLHNSKVIFSVYWTLHRCDN